MQYSAVVRWVDHYVGSVILFVFTILHRVFSFFRVRRARATKNVLVIELVEMGASIMAYSSLRYIKRQNPEARIFVLCTASTKASWALLDLVAPGDIYALNNKNLGALFVSILKQVWALSQKNLDLIIDYELFTRISAILSFCIRTRRRAGFYGYTMGGLYRGNFWDVKCSFNQNMHIAKNLLALTKAALDPSPRYYNWEGPISNDEIIAPAYKSDPDLKEGVLKRVIARLERPWPLMLLAPTVGRMLPMRDYPKELYVEVVRQILKLYHEHAVVMVGIASHDEVAQYIEKTVADPRCVSFCGQTASLRELLELFTAAEILITNDSGNPHFAAMAGLKNVALYGPETPFMYGPLGQSVCLFDFFHSSPSITAYNHKNPPSDSNESLRSISPERIVKTVQLVMKGEAKYGTVNNEIPYLL
jgi:ADP-heptose:LPS heptosyltransferase